MNSEGFYKDTPIPANQENCEFNVYEYQGRVLDGDWDGLTRKFSELDFYRSYEERAFKGTAWELLPYYRRVLAQIESGIHKWGCRNKQELDKRCAMLDRIFNDMKQNGYKSREMLRKEHGKNSLFDETDEITVNIGRHGDLIFNNGRHRLTFAKILGIEKVPVTITVRHSLWEVFKKEIEMHTRNHYDRVYAPLTHIDLQKFSVHYSPKRFEMIKSNIGEKNNTLLDIGASWGYFCHKFEENGFQCTAVENSLESIYFLNKLKRAENRVFKVIPESIFAFSKRGPIKYDIVLALAIFHHFLKESAPFEEFKGLLNNLDMNEMYFEPHVYTEAQMASAFVNFTNEEFVNFILENSCLKNSKLIGHCEEGRVIYKLWR
jgi:2-polyprenyl-3-methyl-5-hydroxy-6-metoxy-1,4-benzoquinol methylase